MRHHRLLERAKAAAERAGALAPRTVLAAGDPAREILAFAEREGADVIVLGSRGRSELKGLLMGSVSHKVCQLAKCTCITVK